MEIEAKYDPDPGLMVGSIAGRISPAMAKGVLRAANHAGGIITETVMATFTSGRGNLARSFVPARFIEKSDKKVSAGALSDLPQAHILDKGGTIRPRTAGALAIPLSGRAKNLWPRDWPQDKLQLIKNKKTGKALLAEVTGTGSSKKTTWHYVLKDEVSIRGRGYIDEAQRKAEEPVGKIMAEVMDEAAQEGLDDA